MTSRIMTSRIIRTSAIVTMATVCVAIIAASTVSLFMTHVHAQRGSTSRASQPAPVPFDVSPARLERNRARAYANRTASKEPDANSRNASSIGTPKTGRGTVQTERVTVPSARTLRATGANLTLLQAGSNLEVRDQNNTVLASSPKSSVDTITINGIDGVPNVLTIDFSRGG